MSENGFLSKPRMNPINYIICLTFLNNCYIIFHARKWKYPIDHRIFKGLDKIIAIIISIEKNFTEHKIVIIKNRGLNGFW